MSDAGQYLRKLIPRSRTPTLDLEERSFESSTTRTRPKLAQFLSYSNRPQTARTFEYGIPDQWSADKPPKVRYDPDIEMMAQSIISRLLDSPYASLPPNHNSKIMHIIEAYQKLATEKQELCDKLNEQADYERSLVEQLRDARAELAEKQGQEHFMDTPRQALPTPTAEHAITVPPIMQRVTSRRRAMTTSSLNDAKVQSILDFIKTIKRGKSQSRQFAISDVLEGFTYTGLELTESRNKFPLDPFDVQRSFQPISAVLEETAHVPAVSCGTPTYPYDAECYTESFSTSTSECHLLPRQVSEAVSAPTMGEQHEYKALTTLANLKASRDGVVLTEALERLVQVYYDIDTSVTSTLDGDSGSKEDALRSCDRYENSDLNEDHPKMRIRSPKRRSGPISAKMQLAFKTDSRATSVRKQQNMSKQPPLSLGSYDVLTGGHSRPKTVSAFRSLSRPLSVQRTDDRGAVVVVSPTTRSTCEHERTQLSRSSPRVPPTSRKISNDKIASRISSLSPKPRAISRSKETREPSNSSVITVLNRSPASMDAMPARKRPADYRRRSSGQPTISGLQSNHNSPSEMRSTVSRRTSLSRLSRYASSDTGSVRRISDVAVAIAAARTAEERGRHPGTSE